MKAPQHPAQAIRIALLLAAASSPPVLAQGATTGVAIPPLPPVSNASTYRLEIPVTAITTPGGACTIGLSRVGAVVDGGSDSLIVRVVKAAGDTVPAEAPASIEILRDGAPYETVSARSTGLVGVHGAKELDQSLIEVVRYTGKTRVCSIVLREPERLRPATPEVEPLSPEEIARRERARRLAEVEANLRAVDDGEFFLRTGGEYTSSDNFSQRGPTLQGSVEYHVPLSYTSLDEILGSVGLPPGGGFFRRPLRLSAVATAERSTMLVTQSRYTCIGFRESIPAPGAGGDPRRACAAPENHGDGTRTFYEPRLREITDPFDGLRGDSTGVARAVGSWQLGALLRLETSLQENPKVLLGPRLSTGLYTDPTGNTSRIGTFIRYGVGVRVLDSKMHDRFGVSIDGGAVPVFRERVTVYDSALVGRHPEVREILGDARPDTAGNYRLTGPDSSVVRRGTWIRAHFQPIPNLYLRGIGQLPDGNRARLLTFSVMFVARLNDVLRTFGFQVPGESEAEESGGSGSD